MKIDKREILSAIFALVPILLLTFIVLLPTLDLLMNPISDETKELTTKLLESYLVDMDVNGEYVLFLMLTWLLLIMIGMYFSLLYISYLGDKLMEKIWGKDK